MMKASPIIWTSIIALATMALTAGGVSAHSATTRSILCTAKHRDEICTMSSRTVAYQKTAIMKRKHLKRKHLKRKKLLKVKKPEGN
jgi:hypothetical protein